MKKNMSPNFISYTKFDNNYTIQASANFLKDLIKAVPYKIHKVLTDNGIQFTYNLLEFQNVYESIFP